MNGLAPTKALAFALALASLFLIPPAHAQTKLRVGICARTVSMGVGSPFAIATKMGWFKQEGLDVEIVPLPGSTDCVKSVATGQLLITLPSVEPLAIVRPQGIKAKVFYTAYQTNAYGLAVPADSPIQKAADLKGKNIGVISLASAGVVVARAQVAAAGLDPDRDVNIVVAGEGAQPAALIRSRQIDALSQFDTQYALIANAGVPMRYLDRSQIERFPGNGFLALEESFKTRRKELVGLGRAYAKGTGFYEFEETHGSAPMSPTLYEDIDALVATAYVEKAWTPKLSASILRLSDTGWSLAEDLRRKVKKDALSGLEDAVAWVKEQSYLELMHKTSTIRVIG